MKSFKKYFTEVISADVRCTNHSALSFGICIDQPVIRTYYIISLLEESFGRQNIVHLTSPTRIIDWDNPTVRQFVKDNPRGHFLFNTSSHAMALHNGKLVDTSRKGKRSQAKIVTAWQVINNDQQINKTFNEYKSKYAQNVF